MIYLVIWLVLIILKAEAWPPETENPDIRLSYTNDRNENFTVWKNKPMKIIIENSFARYVWCSDLYANNNPEKLLVQPTPFNTNIVTILNVTKVTAEMSTRWACVVLDSYHGPILQTYNGHNYTAKTLHFHLYVKGARPVILIANYHNLTYVTTSLSDGHDGEANYTYEDGEEVDFTCNQPKNSDTLRLEYYNAKGIRLFHTKLLKNKKITFRSVLKLTNDKYYLDCVRAAINPAREYRYRTTFYMKERDLYADSMDRGVILYINGQKMTKVNNDTSNDDYVFRYTDGEELNITCQKTDINLKGTLTFYENNRKIDRMALQSPSEGVISFVTSTSNVTNKNISCGINNTDVQKQKRVSFLSDIPTVDIRIRGLPRNNIMYQYTNGLDQWTIEYLYSVNEKLNLTCVSKRGFQTTFIQHGSHDNPFFWKFEGNTIPSAAKSMLNRGTVMYSKKTFTKVLDARHNGSKIKCIYKIFPAYNKTAEIIVRLKPELVSKAEKDKVLSEAEPEQTKLFIVSIAASVGVIVAVITMACLVCWRKRKIRVRYIENAYDNLSNQNDSPIPAFPSQWDANYDDSLYAKIDEEVMQENFNYTADNNKLYTVPYNRQSNTSENHYTEIDEYLNTKVDGMATNWNTGQPSNHEKENNALKGTISKDLTISDPKQGTYDKLMHNSLPNNNSNGNYGQVQKPNKTKTVTFRQISNDLRPGRNHSEGYSRQDCRNNETRLKQNSGGHYANTGPVIHMQPGHRRKKPEYENHSLQSDNAVNPFNLDYAEPYSDIEINCKNPFKG